MIKISRVRFADTLFVLVLALYILAGIALAPFHGDEAMQMSLAKDVGFALSGDWERLALKTPIRPDSLDEMRVLNGPLNKTLIGLAWWLDGRPFESLPDIFQWGLSIFKNKERGNVPDQSALVLARVPSALLGALSVIVLFWIGLRIGGRPMAYPAALVYTLHPVILLSTRRAMMEGGLLFGSLIVIAAAVYIAQRPDRRLRGAILLGVAAGVAVVAKHPAVFMVIGAFAGAFLVWLLPLNQTNFIRSGARAVGLCVIAGVITALFFYAWNPPYWRDPVAAARAAFIARSQLLDSQVKESPDRHAGIADRLEALIVQPFIAPPQYYEAPTWKGQIDGPIQLYEDSAVSGWRWPAFIGAILTLLAGIGGMFTLVRSRRDSVARVLLCCFVASVIGTLTIPLDWQRYYVPGLPIYLLCIGYVPALLRRAIRRIPRVAPLRAVQESA